MLLNQTRRASLGEGKKKFVSHALTWLIPIKKERNTRIVWTICTLTLLLYRAGCLTSGRFDRFLVLHPQIRQPPVFYDWQQEGSWVSSTLLPKNIGCTNRRHDAEKKSDTTSAPYTVTTQKPQAQRAIHNSGLQSHRTFQLMRKTAQTADVVGV